MGVCVNTVVKALRAQFTCMHTSMEGFIEKWPGRLQTVLACHRALKSEEADDDVEAEITEDKEKKKIKGKAAIIKCLDDAEQAMCEEHKSISICFALFCDTPTEKSGIHALIDLAPPETLPEPADLLTACKCLDVIFLACEVMLPAVKLNKLDATVTDFGNAAPPFIRDAQKHLVLLEEAQKEIPITDTVFEIIGKVKILGTFIMSEVKENLKTYAERLFENAKQNFWRSRFRGALTEEDSAGCVFLPRFMVDLNGRMPLGSDLLDKMKLLSKVAENEVSFQEYLAFTRLAERKHEDVLASLSRYESLAQSAMMALAVSWTKLDHSAEFPIFPGEVTTQLFVAQSQVQSFKTYASRVSDAAFEHFSDEFNKASITEADKFLTTQTEKWKSHHMTVLSGALEVLGESYPIDWEDFMVVQKDIVKVRAMIDMKSVQNIGKVSRAYEVYAEKFRTAVHNAPAESGLIEWYSKITETDVGVVAKMVVEITSARIALGAAHCAIVIFVKAVPLSNCCFATIVCTSCCV